MMTHFLSILIQTSHPSLPFSILNLSSQPFLPQLSHACRMIKQIILKSSPSLRPSSIVSTPFKKFP